MCKRALSENLFMLIYCPDKYKTWKMCDEAVGDCLVAFKVFSWLVCYK